MKRSILLSLVACLIFPIAVFSQTSTVYVDYPANALWKATTDAATNWQTLNFDHSSWGQAIPVSSIEFPPRIIAPNSRSSSTSYFRGELNFTYERLAQVKRVLIMIEANTCFDLFFNGRHCGEDTEWPNGPLKAYDVTDLFNSSGKNVIAVKGWVINSTQPSIYCVLRIEFSEDAIERPN